MNLYDRAKKTTAGIHAANIAEILYRNRRGMSPVVKEQLTMAFDYLAMRAFDELEEEMKESGEVVC